MKNKAERYGPLMSLLLNIDFFFFFIGGRRVMGSHLGGAMAWLLGHERVGQEGKGGEEGRKGRRGWRGVGVAARHTPDTLNAKG